MPPAFGIAPRPRHVTPAETLLGHITRGMGRTPVDGSTVRDTIRVQTMPLDGLVAVLVLR